MASLPKWAWFARGTGGTVGLISYENMMHQGNWLLDQTDTTQMSFVLKCSPNQVHCVYNSAFEMITHETALLPDCIACLAGDDETDDETANEVQEPGT